MLLDTGSSVNKQTIILSGMLQYSGCNSTIFHRSGGLYSMAIQLRFLSAQQLEDKTLQRQLGEVYQAAFNIKKKRDGAEKLIEMLEMHRPREGFRCVIAQDDVDQRIVGFAYGYTSRPGYWWFDTVSRSLSRHAIEIWFKDAFEIVELAVHPEWQGQGI